MAAGRSTSPIPNACALPSVSIQWPVTGRSAVTTRQSPARYSYSWSPSMRRLPPWAMTTSSGSVSEYSGGAGVVGTFDSNSPSIGVWRSRPGMGRDSGADLVHEGASAGHNSQNHSQ